MRQKDEETIREVVQRDPLAEISYQEKETLWKQRYVTHCRLIQNYVSFYLTLLHLRCLLFHCIIIFCYFPFQRVLYVSSTIFAKTSTSHAME